MSVIPVLTLMLSQRHQLYAWTALIVGALFIESYRLFPVILMTVVFFLFYALSTLAIGNYQVWPPNGEFIEECAARITSVLHMLLAVPVAGLYACNFLGLEVWLKTQQLTMGYLIYDAIYLCSFAAMYGRPLETTMLFHHLSFYLGITVMPPAYEWYIAMAYLAEISNPFLYLSWYMYKTGLHHTFPRLFKYTAILLLGTFFVFRVVNFSYLLWTVVKMSYIGAVLTAVLWTMNVAWFYKLAYKFKSVSADKIIITKKSE